MERRDGEIGMGDNAAVVIVAARSGTATSLSQVQ